MKAEIPDTSPEAFRRRVWGYYLNCGQPSLREVERTSRSPEFVKWYASVFQGRKPEAVTRNKLWYWLSGNRQTPPDHALLTSFLLVCQWLGFQSTALQEDRGADMLDDWHQDLRRVRAWADRRQRTEQQEDEEAGSDGEQEGPPQGGPLLSAPITAPAPPADLPVVPLLPGRITVAARPAPPVEPQPADPASKPPHAPSHDDEYSTSAAGNQRPLALSALQKACLEGHGPPGRMLAERATAGSAEAAYQAGILLGSSPDDVEVALPLVLHAAAAGHVLALALVLESADRIDPLDAAAHAYELAETAASQSQTALALLWYECAARNRLPTAAMKLAVYYLARADDAAAIRWLRMAADHGSTRAEITLAEITRRDRFPRSRSAVGGARTPYN